ncbi:penicillin acylase family protein [Luteimonas abyssi]|uniref:penicillin acylase family protein n=1 Tax=Luteimonas abyssi TaxID=1247514 RepID=UPI000737D189|nr:penicillin acylase family protein [Luteimonas abyssi]
MRPWIRRARWLVPATLLLLVPVAALIVLLLVRGSLARLEGDAPLQGLSAPATITRDAQGTVTIDAASETDAMRVLGYVHAQERYFEMDLMRRVPAGELAALFGDRALDTDRRRRVHRMRARVESDLETIVGERMPQLQAYADGVNAGLGDLRVRPWPYLLLRQSPTPWTPVDSALTGFAMYFDLQDADNARELARWRLRAHLPAPLYALLTHDGSTWDAPLLGGSLGDAALPAPGTLDLRTLPMPAPDEDGSAAAKNASAFLDPGPAAPDRRRRAAADLRPGSNNFAVSGRLTADGRALLADDMHLGLRAPNIWFRARLRYPDTRAPGGRVDVTGFTLPGLPAVVVGSNGQVAWAFTNSYVDTADWRRLSPCPDEAAGETAPDPGEPAAAGRNGCTPIVSHQESIAVAGGDPRTLQVDETEWGPILHREDDGSALALRWAAHLPGALDFGLADFIRARTLDEVLRFADHAAVPTQNLLVADRSGQIAWRLLGPIPQRAAGCEDVLDEVDRADADGGCPPWPIRTDTSPLLRSPTASRLWTANSRVTSGAVARRLGDGGAALGIRSHQIRDALRAADRFDEHALLAIQLDDRAVLLTRWWALLRRETGHPLPADAPVQADVSATGTPPDAAPALHALAAAAEAWSGHADIDSVAYRLVRAWRLAVHRRIADGLAAPALAVLDDAFELPDQPHLEGVAWPLLQARPAHLLPRAFACASRDDAGADCDDARDGWTALLEAAAREVVESAQADGPLAEWTWGARNTTAICHPLAGAVPWLGRRLLCMPAQALPGDGNTPRVQGPAFGASQRMVVAPGHEADGIAHMPGGQSGHPLSPFWGAGHDDWAAGRATPFLPGAARYTLSLRDPAQLDDAP